MSYLFLFMSYLLRFQYELHVPLKTSASYDILYSLFYFRTIL